MRTERGNADSIEADARRATPKITVTRPDAAHRAAWNSLYAGYADFYKVVQTAEMRDTVWSWIQDEHNEVECFLALDSQGKPVGLAHFREFARPLAASRGCYLDDLFVDPASRGSGAAAALLRALGEEARRRGWSVIRWITADDNYRARSFYDRVAHRTRWVTYDMVPAPAPAPAAASVSE